jgi:hypothetical protein
MPRTNHLRKRNWGRKKNLYQPPPILKGKAEPKEGDEADLKVKSVDPKKKFSKGPDIDSQFETEPE